MEKQTNRTPCDYCGLILLEHSNKKLLAKLKIEIHDFTPPVQEGDLVGSGGIIEEEQIQIDIANAGYSNYSLQ